MDMDRPATAERGLRALRCRPVTLITGASSGIGSRARPYFRRRTATRSCSRRGAFRSSPRSPDSIRAAGHRTPHILPVDLARADSAETGSPSELDGAQSRTGLPGQQCGLWPARPGAQARPRRPARDDRSQLPLAHRSLAALRSTASRAIAAASSTSRRSRASSPAPACRSTTPPRPM